MVMDTLSKSWWSGSFHVSKFHLETCESPYRPAECPHCHTCFPLPCVGNAKPIPTHRKSAYSWTLGYDKAIQTHMSPLHPAWPPSPSGDPGSGLMREKTKEVAQVLWESLTRNAHPLPPGPVPCPPMYLLATRETSSFHSNTCFLSSKLVKRLEGLPISSKPATQKVAVRPGAPAAHTEANPLHITSEDSEGSGHGEGTGLECRGRGCCLPGRSWFSLRRSRYRSRWVKL